MIWKTIIQIIDWKVAECITLWVTLIQLLREKLGITEASMEKITNS